MADMPLVGLRQFRERIDTFRDPVKVVKTRGDITVLGVWVPEGSGYHIERYPQHEIDAHSREVSSEED